jgi:CheY-like chemotaxis protein
MLPRRILVTDDESLFRTSAAESLRARFRGTEVLEAEDGAAALAILERMLVDVLITDLQMPNLGGIDLVARITSHRMPIQIIVVSAFITEPTRVALDDLGALVCVDKPIDLDALHRAVERMLAVPRAHVSGVTLAGFVQLLEMEHQTCALRVVSADGVGTLVFEHGKLADAWTGERAGDAAALSILRFKDCTLDVVGALRPDVQRVTQPLSYLLLESARMADEEHPEHVAGQWELFSLGVPGETVPEAVATPATEEKKETTADVAEMLRAAMEIDGALGAALADAESGRTLGTAGGGPSFDVEVAAAGNTQVLRAEVRLLQGLGLPHALEDILITLGEQYHLIRPLADGGSSLFLYLVIDRKLGNLGLARRRLGKVEGSFPGQRSPLAASGIRM